MRSVKLAAVGLAAAVLLVLVVTVILSAAPRATAPVSPTVALASATPVPSASAPATTVPSPSASGVAGWSRGMYLQTIDAKRELEPGNTRLVAVTRALQRSEVHNEIDWSSVGAWSPDGTAVVATDRSVVQSVVVWADSLTRLPATAEAWTWLDARTVAAVAPAAGDRTELVRVDAHSGVVLKRDPITAWPFGSIVSPTGEWIAFTTAGADGPDYEAITTSTSQRVSSGPHTVAAGWLPDGRFVFVRRPVVDSNSVEIRDPARPDATVIGRFEFPVEVLAQPSSSVIVVHDARIDKNQLWAFRGTERRAVPLQYDFYGALRLDSLSHDDRTASFSMPAVAGVGLRTGFIDLETGAVTFICDGGCFGLVIN